MERQEGLLIRDEMVTRYGRSWFLMHAKGSGDRKRAYRLGKAYRNLLLFSEDGEREAHVRYSGIKTTDLAIQAQDQERLSQVMQKFDGGSIG